MRRRGAAGGGGSAVRRTKANARKVAGAGGVLRARDGACRSHSMERRPDSSSEEVHSNSSLFRAAPVV